MRSPSLEPDAPVVRMFRHTDNLLRGDAKVRGQEDPGVSFQTQQPS